MLLGYSFLKPNFIWVPHIYFQTLLISYWIFPNIFCSIIMLITNISYWVMNYHKKPKKLIFYPILLSYSI